MSIESKDKHKGLKKTLGMWHGVSVIFGSVVGSGIFISANTVLKQCGSIGVTLIVWALCGLLVAFGSFLYIELGCAMPKAGGDYEYLQNSFGHMFSFAFSFSRIAIVAPSSIAVGCLSFGNYLLQPFYPCGVPYVPKVLLAILALTFFAYMNYRSIKAVTRLQLIFGIGKAIALACVVGAGFFALSKGGVKNLAHPFRGTSKSLTSIIAGFYGCIFTFSGWNYLNYVIEEMKEPEKNLPRAAAIAISLIAILYTLINLAYFSLLGKSAVASSQAVAVDALQVLATPLGFVMSIVVSLSVFGLINSMLFASSRVIFSAARNNQMPPLLCYLHSSHRTPVASVVAVTIVALVFICVGTTDGLVYLVAFSESVFLVLTFFAFVYLRRTRPHMNRPFKAFAPIVWIFGITMILITIAGLIQETKSCLIALGIIIGGTFCYVTMKNSTLPKSLAGKIDRTLKFLQTLMLASPTAFEDSES